MSGKTKMTPETFNQQRFLTLENDTTFKITKLVDNGHAVSFGLGSKDGSLILSMHLDGMEIPIEDFRFDTPIGAIENHLKTNKLL